MSTQGIIDAARRINERTFSHVTGKDLLAELHPRSQINIHVRRDGEDYHYEGDWLSGLFDEVKRLRAVLVHYDPDWEHNLIVAERLRQNDPDQRSGIVSVRGQMPGMSERELGDSGG